MESAGHTSPDGLPAGASRPAVPRSVYLLTLPTVDRQPWLGRPRTRDVFLAVLRAWHAERHGQIVAASAMPDRASVLLQFGGSATLGQVIAGWKAALRRGAGYEETFQADYFEHRVGDDEVLEDYALYLFLQPYRDRLAPPTESFAGWWCPDAGRLGFMQQLSPRGGPQLEWLRYPPERFAKLVLGA